MDADKVFAEILPVFKANKKTKNVEMEMRLGRMNGKTFDSNIGVDAFNKIMKALDKHEGWEEMTESKTDVYYHDMIRMVTDKDGNVQDIHTKKRLKNINLNLIDRPFDARFSVSTETPVKDFDETTEMDDVKSRQRRSFLRKNLRIDMTIVHGDDSDPDCEEGVAYQVEMEIVDPKKVEDDKMLYNILFKLQNILDTLK